MANIVERRVQRFLYDFLDANDEYDRNVVLTRLDEAEREYFETIQSERRKEDFLRGRCVIQRRLPEGVSFRRAMSGEIVWPKGYIGSLAHTKNHVAAAVYPDQQFRSVGLDLEMFGRVKLHLREKICTSEELLTLSKLPEEKQEMQLTELFCIKEAVYKCFFPIYREYLAFDDAEVIEYQSEQSEGKCRIKAENLVIPFVLDRFAVSNGSAVISLAYLP